MGPNHVLISSCKGVWAVFISSPLKYKTGGMAVGHQSTTVIYSCYRYHSLQPLGSKARIQSQFTLFTPRHTSSHDPKWSFLSFQIGGSFLSGTCLAIFLVSKFAFTYYIHSFHCCHQLQDFLIQPIQEKIKTTSSVSSLSTSLRALGRL